MKIQILHTKMYTAGQRCTQTMEDYFLFTLIVSGLKCMTLRAPGETGVVLQAENMSLVLAPPGWRLDFEFDSRRENHAMLCRLPDVTCRPFPELNWDGTVLKLPVVRRVTPSECAFLRGIFLRVETLAQEAVPSSVFAAEQLTAGMLGELAADFTMDSASDSPEEQLRRKIDSDRGFRIPLRQFSRELGFSSEYLRKRFSERYGIDPGQYRMRIRLNRILVLLDRDDLSLKEIAAEAGMKNVTHLYAFFRSRCGMTPGALRKSGKDHFPKISAAMGSVTAHPER